jgi:ABC-type phosphate transport system permease subunit
MQQSFSGTKRVARLLGGDSLRLSDMLFRGFTMLLVLFVVVIIGAVTWLLVGNSMPTIQQFGWSFLTNQAFDPVHNVFGVAPAIFGTLVTSAFAILFAVPIGVGTAIFLVDFCPRSLQRPLAFIVELLAAVPSVIYGLFGFLVLAPWLQTSGQPWLQRYLGFLPLFQGQFHGLGLLAAGVILVIMVLPLITSISREVILTTPISQCEALLALGATRWEVIRHAVLPYARSIQPMYVRRHIGMVFQRPNPLPTSSVFENVAIGLRLNGLARGGALKEIVERSLKQAALWDEVKDRLNESASALSGGQQQRLCIARALASET